MTGSALLDAALYAVGLVAAFGLATARRRRRVGPALLVRPRARLRQLLDQAGLPHVPVVEFVGASAGLAALGGVPTVLFLGWPTLGLAVGLATGLLPLLGVVARADGGRAALLAAVPDGLAQLRDALEGGLSVQVGLQGLASDDGPEHLRAEAARLLADEALFGALRPAVEASAERVADPLWDVVCATLLLERRVGGSQLARAFDELARTARADLQVLAEAAARRAGVVWSARILAGLPLAVLVLGRAAAPGYFAVYDQPEGQLWLGLGLLAITGVGSLLWLLSRPPRPPRVLFGAGE